MAEKNLGKVSHHKTLCPGLFQRTFAAIIKGSKGEFMFRMLHSNAAKACWLSLLLLVAACGVKKVELKIPAAIKNARTLNRAAVLNRFDQLCRQGSTLIVRKPTFIFSSESLTQGVREIFPTAPGLLILSRKGDLRFQVRDPVLHHTYADLAATGDRFKFYYKDHRKVYVGSSRSGAAQAILGDNEDKGTRQNLAKMRPWHINQAFFLDRMAADSQLTVTEEDSPLERFYVVHEIQTKDGVSRILQSVWIERIGFDIRRKILYDDNGAPLADVEYNVWEGDGDKRYPADMLLRRPQEEYQVRFRLDKVSAGDPIVPDMMELIVPESIPVEDLDRPKEGNTRAS
jgi:hypothetical protein